MAARATEAMLFEVGEEGIQKKLGNIIRNVGRGPGASPFGMEQIAWRDGCSHNWKSSDGRVNRAR